MFEEMQKRNPDYIMNQKLASVEREIGDIKKEVRNNDLQQKDRVEQLREDVGKNKGNFGGLTNTNIKAIKEMIEKETEDIWNFLTQFVNEEAVNCINTLKIEHKYTGNQKMDAIDWMIRNVEFVSGSIYSKMIDVCRQIYTSKNTSTTDVFFSQHESKVMNTIQKVILEC